MKKFIAIACLGLFIASCSRVPLTGRKQVTWIPGGQMRAMSFAQYKSFLTQKRPETSGTNYNMVKKVGQKLEQAVTSYMSSKGLSDNLKGYQWEYNLVNDKAVNAFAMPGGKVVIYSGLLPVTQSEAGLAAVMGHELSHVIAEHGNERMSKTLIAQGLAIGGSAAISANNPQHVNIFNQAFGMGAQGVLLAFSRKHELEADRMGMIFMARAGYDPKEAIGVWQRMGKQGGAKPPEILSTHPHDATRIANLQKYLEEANVHYRPNNRRR